MKGYVCDICQIAYTKNLGDTQFNEKGNWIVVNTKVFERGYTLDGFVTDCEKRKLHICPRCQRLIIEYCINNAYGCGMDGDSE